MRRCSWVLVALWACDDGSDANGQLDRLDMAARPADLGADGAPDVEAPDAAAPDEGLGGADGAVTTTPRWEAAAPVAAGAIQEIAVVALAGRIYVLGGFDAQARIVNTVSVYDPEADAWSTAAPLPARMHHANAAAVGGRIYVLGYLVGGFAADGRGFVYDPEADAWSEAPSMPEGFGRGASGVAVVGSRILIVGGMSAGRVYPFVHGFDTVTGTWERLPDLPTLRDHMATGVIEGVVVVAGGRAGDIGSHVPRVDLFDPAVGEWTAGSPMPTSRGGAAAAVLGGSLYVIGGEGNAEARTRVFPQVEAYHLASDTWSRLPPMETPRHGMAAAAVGDRIYVPGGATVQAFGAVDTHEVLVPE